MDSTYDNPSASPASSLRALDLRSRLVRQLAVHLHAPALESDNQIEYGTSVNKAAVVSKET